jgi:membrane protein YdbS with pleckstrin-like domain
MKRVGNRKGKSARYIFTYRRLLLKLPVQIVLVIKARLKSIKYIAGGEPGVLSKNQGILLAVEAVVELS